MDQVALRVGPMLAWRNKAHSRPEAAIIAERFLFRYAYSAYATDPQLVAQIAQGEWGRASNRQLFFFMQSSLTHLEEAVHISGPQFIRWCRGFIMPAIELNRRLRPASWEGLLRRFRGFQLGAGPQLSRDYMYDFQADQNEAEAEAPPRKVRGVESYGAAGEFSDLLPFHPSLAVNAYQAAGEFDQLDPATAERLRILVETKPPGMALAYGAIVESLFGKASEHYVRSVAARSNYPWLRDAARFEISSREEEAQKRARAANPYRGPVGAWTLGHPVSFPVAIAPRPNLPASARFASGGEFRATGDYEGKNLSELTELMQLHRAGRLQLSPSQFAELRSLYLDAAHEAFGEGEEDSYAAENSTRRRQRGQ